MLEDDLTSRWIAAGRPHDGSVKELRGVLEREFRAYSIPIESYGKPMYRGDDQLDVGEVVCLMTITHPDVLSRIYGEEEREMQDIGADAVDEYERTLFTGPQRDPDEPISGGFLNMEHALGRRSSIVISATNEAITGYRLLGESAVLSSLLDAYAPVFIGAEVSLGDSADPEFRYHLENMAKAGRI